ncbi:two pore channel protein 2-like isoform X2 [Watersipora subatra]|uniref:two pore channel protein 2-like isoform X2 n=1 Tax=Watersipora subatra TaxID=2589382 RepID=UPI00355AFDC6
MASDYRNMAEESGDDYENSRQATELEFMYDKATIDTAAIFLEDAIMYRSIYHKVDSRSLRIYRFYHSTPAQLFIHFIVFTLHILAFFENPSSLTRTSDLRQVSSRWRAPCGALESLELFCLIILLVDQILKTNFIGWERVKKSKWIIAAYVVCILSITDCLVYLMLSCKESIRIRRMVRPFFVIQRSTMVKKVWNCLRRTLPEIASVLLLLLIHLYFFTMFGMLLFPTPHLPNYPGNTLSSNNSPANQTLEDQYFRNFNTSFISLLVLLTTANNPDVMMPAYTQHRMSALFFIVFLAIGLYCLMNMLTAVVYNQFKGYFKGSMTSSLFRRHLGIRAAFEMLRQQQLRMSRVSVSVHVQRDGGIPKNAVLATIPRVRISERAKECLRASLSNSLDYLSPEQFQNIFVDYEKRKSANSLVSPIPWLAERTFAYKLQSLVTHAFFGYFGCAVVLSNVIAISVLFSTQYDISLGSIHSSIHVMNLCFAAYYVAEKMLLIWANGHKRFTQNYLELFDCFILLILVVLEIVFFSIYSQAVIPRHDNPDQLAYDPHMWQLVKAINLLIIFRLIRLLPQIKALFYLFAILGMELFANKITPPSSSIPSSNGSAATGYNSCGTYEQLNYWANNFDDFAASLVVLWDIMVVNNWHVFLQVYTERVSPWSQLYFITFWILSTIICVNLFTAMILENFIMRWDKHHSYVREMRERAQSVTSTGYSRSNNPLSMHEMFSNDIVAPQEDELIADLRLHEHVQFDIN